MTTAVAFAIGAALAALIAFPVGYRIAAFRTALPIIRLGQPFHLEPGDGTLVEMVTDTVSRDPYDGWTLTAAEPRNIR